MVNLRGTRQARKVGQPEGSHAGKEGACMQKCGPRGHCAGGELPGRPGDLGGGGWGLPAQRGQWVPGTSYRPLQVTGSCSDGQGWK